MRGDRPRKILLIATLVEFTPHARGSTMTGEDMGRAGEVYPACAGIDRKLLDKSILLKSLPRMRGDRPVISMRFMPCPGFTPHARGSTCCHVVRTAHEVVYPACAGIDPGICRHRLLCTGLPRMRGDRPRLL